MTDAPEQLCWHGNGRTAAGGRGSRRSRSRADGRVAQPTPRLLEFTAARLTWYSCARVLLPPLAEEEL